MTKQSILYIGSLLLISLCSTVTMAKGMSRGIEGEVRFTKSNDTVFLVFEITPVNFEPDQISLMLEVTGEPPGSHPPVYLMIPEYGDGAPWVTIYRASDSASAAPEWRTVRRVRGRLWISGRIPTSLKGKTTQNWLVSFQATPIGKPGWPVYESTCVRTDYFGLGLELPVAYGYFKSSMASPFDKQGIFVGLGIGLERGKGPFRFESSTSWSGLGHNFTFSEPFRLGARFYTGTRSNFLPQFYGAVKLSKLMLKRDDARLRDLDWGGEFGMATEGPFERLGYHYSTALGGYHTIELFLSRGSGQPFRGGTRYQLRMAEGVWEIRVSLNFEGWYTLESPDMVRHNNRPLPHKILATLGAGPLLIFALPTLIGGR